MLCQTVPILQTLFSSCLYHITSSNLISLLKKLLEVLILSYSLCCFLFIFKLASKNWDFTRSKKNWVICLSLVTRRLLCKVNCRVVWNCKWMYYLKHFGLNSVPISTCNFWFLLFYINIYSMKLKVQSEKLQTKQPKVIFLDNYVEKTVTRLLITNSRDEMHVMDD